MVLSTVPDDCQKDGTYFPSTLHVLIYIFWSFQPSPTTVKRMALISRPPCIF